ncbi:MAG: hypothetical protein JNK82_13055 [Myxococcaceae bacterium]|nr:hypothetical protein [Myxococcaceae bacterium]
MWSITIPPGQSLNVNVAPSPLLDTNLAIMPAGQCTGQCLASGSSGGAGVPDNLSFSNSGTAPLAVNIVVTGTQVTPQSTYTITATFTMATSGDTCTGPTPLTANTTVMATLVGLQNNPHATGANCAQNSSGPDAWWSITVPGGQRVTVTVTPSAGADLSVTLTLPSCTPGGCLASGDGFGPNAVDVASFTNPSMAPQEVYVVVDSFTTMGTPYTLRADVGPPPSGDTCASAQPLVPGTTVMATLAGLANDPRPTGPNCSNVPGPDAAWSLTVGAGERLTVVVTPNPSLNPLVTLIAAPASNCGLNTACLAGATLAPTGQPETLVWTNNSMSAVSVFVIVDAAQATAMLDYTILATLAPPPGGDVCSSATVLALPGSRMGDSTASYVDDYTFGQNCAFSTSPDRVYSVTVPTNTRATITLTPDFSTTARLSIVDTATCTPNAMTCFSSSGPTGVGLVSNLVYDNVSAAPKQLFAIVDAASGNYSISSTAGVPAPGDLCQTAPAPIAATTSFSDTLSGFVDHYTSAVSPNACRFVAGPDRVYAFTLPTNRRLTVTVIANGTWDPALSLVEAPATNCDRPATCITGSNASGTAETLRYSNVGAATQQLYLIVDGSSAAAGFDLIAFIDDAPAPPTGDVCAAAGAPISMNQTLTAQTTQGYANDYASAGCGNKAGADRTYAVSVPAGQRLRVTVTTTSTWNPALGLVVGAANACSAGLCAVQADQGPTNSETLTFVNTGMTAADGFVIVDSATPTGAGTYDIAFVFDVPPPPPPGDTCGSAPVLTAGTLTMQTTTGLNNDYSPSPGAMTCTGFEADGLDRAFVVTVPAGEELRVTVTPTGPGVNSDDPSLYLIPAPATNCVSVPQMCLAGADTGVGGDPETVFWRNNSMTAATVYLVVDAFNGSLQEFTMVTTIAP